MQYKATFFNPSTSADNAIQNKNQIHLFLHRRYLVTSYQRHTHCIALFVAPLRRNIVERFVFTVLQSAPITAQGTPRHLAR